jgi:hypothetical protein
MLSKTQCPFTGPYTVEGLGKHKGPTALALKRAMARMGFLRWEPARWDDRFNARLEQALDTWDPGKDGYGPGRWASIRAATTDTGEPALDSVALNLIRGEHKATKKKVPDLGPVFHGGSSILFEDLTHETYGIPLYPAFDTAYQAGTGIIAPEPMEVFKASSSRPGDACYLLGESGLRYWVAHLVYAPPVGRQLDREDLIGRVVATSIGGGSHAHWGVNVERLWGAGQELVHHDNYTHNGFTIGEQLAAHSVL